MKIVLAIVLASLSASLPALAQSGRDAATQQAENRRFISVGMTRDQVVATIGRPDYTRVQSEERTPAGNFIKITDYAVYEPRPGDEQTRTTVYYVGDAVNLVKRDVVRKP